MAEPKAYEPEKLTVIAHVVALKETETEENCVRRLNSCLRYILCHALFYK